MQLCCLAERQKSTPQDILSCIEGQYDCIATLNTVLFLYIGTCTGIIPYEMMHDHPAVLRAELWKKLLNRLLSLCVACFIHVISQYTCDIKIWKNSSGRTSYQMLKVSYLNPS